MRSLLVAASRKWREESCWGNWWRLHGAGERSELSEDNVPQGKQEDGRLFVADQGLKAAGPGAWECYVAVLQRGEEAECPPGVPDVLHWLVWPLPVSGRGVERLAACFTVCFLPSESP